jgi:hypothetical protein
MQFEVSFINNTSELKKQSFFGHSVGDSKMLDK